MLSRESEQRAKSCKGVLDLLNNVKKGYEEGLQAGFLLNKRGAEERLIQLQTMMDSLLEYKKGYEIEF